MKSKFMLYVLAAAVGAIQMGAATLNFDSVDGVKDSSGNFVSPYSGRINGLSYQLYCADFAHNIFVSDVETVNVSNLNNLSLTRFGGQTASVSLYEQVFYLSTFMTSTSYSRGDVQDAMWSVFSPGNYPNGSSANVQALITQAQTYYAGRDYSNFYILTDATNQFAGKQELFVNTLVSPPMITSTPEPATWALLLGALSVLTIAQLRAKTGRSLHTGK